MADEAPTDTQDPAAPTEPPQAPPAPFGGGLSVDQMWGQIVSAANLAPINFQEQLQLQQSIQGIAQILHAATTPPPVPPAPEPNRETRRAAGERSAPRTPRPRTPKPRAGKKS